MCAALAVFMGFLSGPKKKKKNGGNNQGQMVVDRNNTITWACYYKQRNYHVHNWHFKAENQWVNLLLKIMISSVQQQMTEG